MTIDATIQRLTGDGEIIAQFLVDTLQGYTHDATVSHRLKSAEWLTAFGRLIPESAIPKSASIRPRPKPDKRDKLDKKPKVTEKQILHFDIARLIKQETNDGETIIEFLIRVISKIEETGENFTPAVRMRAARELLIRGFGGTIPGVRRILSGKTEDLDSYLSKIVREYTNYGADSIRFLVETMENKDPEAESRGAASFIKLMRMRPRTKPAEGFTASHRVWAACELLRRAYDIKTDHITYEDIQGLLERTHARRRPQRRPRQSRGQPQGFHPRIPRNPSSQNARRRRATRRRRKYRRRQTDRRRQHVVRRPSRAARRREQRAERKTLKRIPLFPNRRRTREDVAEMLAFKAELESRRPAAFEFQRRQSEKRKADAENIAVPEKSADEQRDNAKQPADATEKRNADAEKIDVAAEQRDADKQPAVDKNPAAANPPSANPGNLAAPPADANSATLAKPKSAPPVSNPPLPRISPPPKSVMSTRCPPTTPPKTPPTPTRRQPPPAARHAAANSAPPAKPKSAKHPLPTTAAPTTTPTASRAATAAPTRPPPTKRTESRKQSTSPTSTKTP